MTNEEYLKASEKTEKKFAEGLFLNARHIEALETEMALFRQSADNLDELKKVIVYGKKDEYFDAPEAQTWIVLRGQDKAEILHAALGIATEAAELAGHLYDAIRGSTEFDIPNIVEELGDAAWFQAILLRKFGITQEQVQEVNIAKLAARYPDKFSEERALNRDTDAERKVLERGVN